MKNKIITILGLFLLMTAVAADELSDKQKQLDKIQKDVQQAENKISQNEAKKKKNETVIKNVKQAKQKTDVELRRSQSVANEKLQKLNSVNFELHNVEHNINELRSMQADQLDKMVRLSRKERSLGIVQKSQRSLSVMAVQTTEKLNHLGDTQYSLSHEQRSRGYEYNLASMDLKEKSSASSKLDQQARNLQAEQNKLTREQQQLQDRIAKLQKDKAQLESLIASLTSKPKPKPEGTEPKASAFSARTIAWPLKGRIIRGYGQETKAYNTSVVSNGIDIAVAEWTGVSAAADGTVIFSGSYGGQGKLLIIDHNNGFFTVYGYNNDLLVSTGATVKKGQIIAKSGMTGSASEPSLHFEVRKDGKAVNPLSYLE